jgi:hypothetical protein
VRLEMIALSVKSQMDISKSDPWLWTCLVPWCWVLADSYRGRCLQR